MAIYADKPYYHCSPIFRDNKWTRWHDSIIERALFEHRKKSKTGPYYESHHIVPKSLGGEDLAYNRVLLTAKEHFVVHLCLTKMFMDDYSIHSMKHAMSNLVRSSGNQGRKISAWQYEIARKLHAEAARQFHTGRVKSETERSNISKALKGKPKTPEALRNSKEAQSRPEVREKKSRAMKGRVFSDQHKQKISESAKTRSSDAWQKGWETRRRAPQEVQDERRVRRSAKSKQLVHTDESKKKISDKLKGRKKTDEHIRKIADATRNRSPEVREYNRQRVIETHWSKDPEKRALVAAKISATKARKAGATLDAFIN